MINLQLLVQEHLNFPLTPDQLQAFKTFEDLLQEWNQKFNLTSITDPDEIRMKHFYDSLTCLKAITDDNASIIDIGCGAGFPGIPLKIIKPGIKLVLVDSVRKKTDFCSVVVETLNLDNVSVLHERVEDIGQDVIHREKYDWAVARAVAPLPVLAEFLLPLLPVGGNALAQKGANPETEVRQAKNAIALLGGKISAVQEFVLPLNAGKRTLVTIKKIKTTPKKYPRKSGLPKKKPLGLPKTG